MLFRSPALQITQLVFVDPSTSNINSFLDATQSGIEVVWLNPNQDGLQQIAAITSQYTNLDAIHILAANNGNQLTLGSGTLTTSDIASRGGEVTQISKALKDTGTVDFYATDSSDINFVEKIASVASSSGLVEAQRLVAANPQLDGGHHEIVFIDSNVDNWQQLAADVKPGIEIVLINGAGNGLQEISDYLSGQSNIDAIHFVSHGNQGELFFGSLDVTLNNLTD